MNKNTVQNIVVFFGLAIGLGVGWWYVNKEFFPPPPPKKPVEPEAKQLSPRELTQALAGGAASVDGTFKPVVPKVEPPKVEPPKIEPKTQTEPHQLVALGNEGWFKRVLLTSQGAAVQQVILPMFDESTREGKEARDADGKVLPLHLIPGTVRKREKSVRQKWDYPGIHAGTDFDKDKLCEPSYVLYHFPAVGDPERIAEKEGVKADLYPSPLLAQRNWKLVENKPGTEESDASATFETDLDAPYHIKIRKIYTLNSKDFHLSLKLEFIALAERPGAKVKDRAKLRYQIAGARGLPIEGEWYTSNYRNAYIGWQTPNGNTKRMIEDSATVQASSGGTQVLPTDGTLMYAGIGTQYFASVLAIDETQPEEIRKSMWAYARPTRELWSGTTSAKIENLRDHPDKAFLGDQLDKPALGDITVRVASNALDPQPGATITHQYIIYNGPLKVRLLKQLRGDKAVTEQLLTRYHDTLGLKTLADYHSPHFFGRLANSIWWADLVIMFTNIMHTTLGYLHTVVPVWGVDILLLTVLVRLILMIPSRKQQMMMSTMQAKMAALKPEIDKIAEKYKGDYHRINQEKTKLMFQNGVNPLSSMSGCLLMLAQMPVFLGLYFCLQESIYFRLDSFLWIPNLAAPDMLVWWTEGIPFVSDPDGIGGTLYLGPYLNILPIIAVGLMFTHQKMSMPPPTDDQQAMQQKMMKFMMIFMGIIFYKMAAGLCLYFIASTSWAIVEKKLLPKPEIKPGFGGTGGPDTIVVPPGGANKSNNTPAGPPKPVGFIGRMKVKLEEMQRKADEQSKRQIRNDPKPDKKKKKK